MPEPDSFRPRMSSCGFVGRGMCQMKETELVSVEVSNRNNLEHYKVVPIVMPIRKRLVAEH